jgi:hypothetical protein
MEKYKLIPTTILVFPSSVLQLTVVIRKTENTAKPIEAHIFELPIRTEYMGK